MNAADARRIAGAVAASLMLCALWIGPGVESAAAAPCPNANSGTDDANAGQLAKALRCLVNDDRGARDLHRLSDDAKLREAAAKHNKTMLDENCWAHDCAGEPNLERRIRNTGYLNGAKRWSFAETFGCADTPRAMLSTWRQHGFTRKSMRNPRFRDLGVAAARDQVPESDCVEGTEITFTAVFARRTP